MRNNEKGYTLLFVMMIIVVISVLGITLMTASSNTSNTIVHERTNQSTYYIAETGINLEKAKIIEIIAELYEQARQSFNALETVEQQELLNIYRSYDQYYNHTIAQQFCNSYNSKTNTTSCKSNNALHVIEYSNQYALAEQFNKKPISSTTVTLNCQTTPCEFTVAAKGYFEDQPMHARSLKQQLIVDSTVLPNLNGNGEDDNDNNPPQPITPLDNVSALTTGNIELSGGASIEGDASTLGKVELSGGTTITGNIHATDIDAPNYMNNILAGKQQKPIELDLASLLPAFPNDTFTTLANVPFMQNEEIGSQNNKHNILQDGNYDASNYQAANYELVLAQQNRFKTFTIGIDNTIYLNIGSQNVDLYVDSFDISRGHIKLIGTGTLNIYVTNELNVHGSIHRDGNPNNVNIFYKGSDTLNFSGDANISGTIYTQSSDLNITGGAKITGNIYSGGQNVDISGGVSTNGQYIVAPNAHLDLTGGGKIYGTVIAHSIDGSGGTKIIYGQPVVPLPTLPSTPQIVVEDKDNYLTESPLIED